MTRVATILLVLLLPLTAFAQEERPKGLEVPPGPSFDPAKHPNPFITFVQIKDFKASTDREAQDTANVQLMGISKETGSLESIAVAQPPLDATKELKLDVRATFYPVVRQIFKIAAGGEVHLYSFKPPRVEQGFNRFSIGGMPTNRGNRTLDPKRKRFGSVELPEDMEVRGRPGLFFEDNGTLTVVWQEEGVIYAATSKLSKKTLFNVIDDLL